MAVPPLPFAVRVYVVSVSGETFFVPLEVATAPRSGTKDTLVALEVDQVSLVESPSVMDVCEAESEQVGPEGGGGETVTVVEQVAVRPSEPVAVPVYVVVVGGVTLVEPPAVGVTVPTLLLIANETAFFVVHESDEAPPAIMLEGVAESVQEGGGGLQVICVWQWTVPPGPMAVSV
jgi:hypothetical protein